MCVCAANSRLYKAPATSRAPRQRKPNPFPFRRPWVDPHTTLVPEPNVKIPTKAPFPPAEKDAERKNQDGSLLFVSRMVPCFLSTYLLVFSQDGSVLRRMKSPKRGILDPTINQRRSPHLPPFCHLVPVFRYTRTAEFAPPFLLDFSS